MGSSDQHNVSGNGQGSGNGAGSGGNGRHKSSVVWVPPPMAKQPADDSVDLAQLWGLVRDGWRAIVLIASAVFLGVMVWTLANRMEFTIRSSLYLGDLQSNGSMLDTLSQFDLGAEKGDIGTETEILRSRERMTQAVLASGLNTRLVPKGWSAPRYWRWRLNGRDLKQLQGAWAELRAVDTHLTDTSSGAREVQISFSSPTEYVVRSGGKQLGAGVLGKPLTVPGIELRLISGVDRGPASGSAYTLAVLPMQTVIEEVSQHFTAKAPKASMGSQVNVMHLQFTTGVPYHGQMFLEALMRGYLEQNLAWKTEQAGAAERFLTKQLENIRASFDKAGKDLAEFKKGSRTIVLSEQAKSMIEQMGTIEQQRVAARLQVEAFQQVKTAIAKGNVPTEAFLIGEAQDTVLIEMSENLAKSQLELKRLSEQFTPDYPPVREAKAALDSQLDTVRGYVTTRLKRAEEQVASLNTEIQRVADQLKELPDTELQLATLTQETEVYAKLYQFLLERQQQAALTKASTISKSRVLDSPILPSREGFPKLRIRIAVGLGIGLLLGIGFVLARWRLATAFQSEAEIRAALPGIALFASVPRRNDGKKRGNQLEITNPVEAFAVDVRSSFAEAFRLLRTNLYYSGSRDRDKVVLISSPGPGDGKTSTTLCLAGILAADGKRVLVIDGDMRKPSHHILLRQAQNPGLSGILTNETPWRKAVHAVDTSLGTFSSISTGIVPPNPAELLSSPSLAAFLAEAREAYDFILLDSPPFPLVSDALVLSQYADRQLSVIRVGRTHRRVAEEHVRRLAPATSHYGIIVNDVASGRGYGYGYGDPYGYGGRETVHTQTSTRSDTVQS